MCGRRISRLVYLGPQLRLEISARGVGVYSHPMAGRSRTRCGFILSPHFHHGPSKSPHLESADSQHQLPPPLALYFLETPMQFSCARPPLLRETRAFAPTSAPCSLSILRANSAPQYSASARCCQTCQHCSAYRPYDCDSTGSVSAVTRTMALLPVRATTRSMVFISAFHAFFESPDDVSAFILVSANRA